MVSPPVVAIMPQVLSLITGGLTGSLLTLYFTNRRAKTEVSMKLIAEYRELYNDISVALGILEAPNVPRSDTEAINKVRMVGDWFNTVAALYQARCADKRLLENAGVLVSMKDFRRRLSTSSRFVGEKADWPTMSELKIPEDTQQRPVILGRKE